MDREDQGPSPKKDTSKKEAPTKAQGGPPIQEDPRIALVAKTVSEAAAGVVHSRAKLNMLSFLLSECEEAEKVRSPEDQIQRTNIEKNIAEKFLLDRSESPLQEMEEAKRYLEVLQRPIKVIDESDPDSRTLGDVLEQESPEKFQEIQSAIQALIREDTIQEKIRGILLQSSPELLEDYQKTHDVIGSLTQKQNLDTILGENPTKEDEQEFQEILKEEEQECQGWAMLEAEKARILCHALTLPESSNRKGALMAEAKNLLGEDTVNLVQQQIAHTTNTILRLYANDQEPSGTAEEVICPTILERMGEAGPNKQQVQALANVQEFYLFRRGDNPPSNEELIHQVARTALATLYLVEHAQWTQNTNVLKEYHEVIQSKKKDFDKFLEERGPKTEEPEETPENHAEPANSENPKSGIPGKKSPYQTRLENIGKLIDTFNEGTTDEKKQVKKEDSIAKLDAASKGEMRGLFSLTEEKVQEIVKHKNLGTAICAYLGKEKNKASRKEMLKKTIQSQMGYHQQRLQRHMFASTWEKTKQAVMPDKNEIFGQNSGMVQAIKETGIDAMDR